MVEDKGSPQASEYSNSRIDDIDSDRSVEDSRGNPGKEKVMRNGNPDDDSEVIGGGGKDVKRKAAISTKGVAS